MKKLLLILICFPIIGFGQESDSDTQLAIDNLGNWDVKTTINPIDDSKTVVLTLYDDAVVNNLDQSVYLIVSCQAEETELYMGWGIFLGIWSRSVLVRLGDGKAKKQVWAISNDKLHTVKSNPKKFIAANQLKNNANRAIADFISGMTDRYAINLQKNI